MSTKVVSVREDGSPDLVMTHLGRDVTQLARSELPTQGLG